MPYGINLFWLLAILFATGIFGALTAFWFVSVYRRREVAKFFSKPVFFPNSRSKYKTVDAVKLHYLCEGSGPDIILIHGIAANIYCWRHLIPLLAKTHRVWAIDLMGFGQSDKPLIADYTFEGQAKLLLKFFSDEKLKNVTVVGNSMGGGIATEMASLGGELIKNLVLIDSAHDRRMFGLNHRALGVFMEAASPFVRIVAPFVNTASVKTYIGRLYSKSYKFSDEDVRAYLEPYVTGTAPHLAFVSAYNGLVKSDLTEKLRNLKNHVLILWGKSDRLLPVRFGDLLHESLPLSHYQVHPTGGHHLQEEEPQWVAKNILDFLSTN